ncbi:proton-coupled amino acid transporter-like protein CG1139 isoform X2 [Cataglyphis hispanica]|uniref:proton-coupled amino acid transporter-like protein CG1139 isoform X2 n=1 Tax=Cataglyphis hispanica TaxID=1086592 RepID=UPI0021805D1E|nr:proton-coupled amino acid transporter-like protein CG1139 isoform X2 [Cataglyphis hispanica]
MLVQLHDNYRRAKQDAENQPSGSTNNDVYDPHMHRVTYKPVSDFNTLANLVKSAAGTGLFAMPNAFACVGLFIGIVGTAFMGLLITGSLQLLVRIHHLMCTRVRKPVLIYEDVVVTALTRGVREPWLSARTATLIVDVTMLACYIGIGSVYVVFISGIVQECIDTEKTIGQGYYALMLFPLLFIMNMAKNLADIAPISVAGNILLLAAGGIGIVYALKDGIGDVWTTIGPNVHLYPKFIGVVFFSMCSPGVILAIEHSMKKPWNYVRLCGILNWGMIFLILIHIFVGSVGYLKWGPDALGNFIRNHEELDGPTVAALIMQALAIYFTYGLQCYMPITILKDGYALPAIESGAWKGTPFLWDLIIRFGITLITCIFAAAIPKLDLFTGLVGAICISTLATLIPVTLYILVHYEDFGKFKWRLILGVSMFSIAFFAAICAVVTNLKLIVEFLIYGD